MSWNAERSHSAAACRPGPEVSLEQGCTVSANLRDRNDLIWNMISSSSSTLEGHVRSAAADPARPSRPSKTGESLIAVVEGKRRNGEAVQLERIRVLSLFQPRVFKAGKLWHIESCCKQAKQAVSFLALFLSFSSKKAKGPIRRVKSTCGLNERRRFETKQTGPPGRERKRIIKGLKNHTRTEKRRGKKNWPSLPQLQVRFQTDAIETAAWPCNTPVHSHLTSLRPPFSTPHDSQTCSLHCHEPFFF